jgi:hypothetical protein
VQGITIGSSNCWNIEKHWYNANMVISDKSQRKATHVAGCLAPMTFPIMSNTFPHSPFAVIFLIPIPLQPPFSRHRMLKNPSL